MKNFHIKTAARIAIGAFALLWATSAYAQTRQMRVQIPFAFRAGDQLMPAGEYRTTLDPVFRQMTLLLRDGGSIVFVPGVKAERRAATNRGILVFRKYGNQYFLRRVWNAGTADGFELFRSKAEREMAKAYPRVELASIEGRTR